MDMKESVGRSIDKLTDKSWNLASSYPLPNLWGSWQSKKEYNCSETWTELNLDAALINDTK